MFKLSPAARAAAALCVLLSVWCVRADDECELAAPRDVHFYSVNLRNTVRWSSGTADTCSINYTVEYGKYGDAIDVDGRQLAWRAVQQCDDITETECDLTEQTGNQYDEYYARVRANGPNGSSEWTDTGSRRFRLTDTILGPPQLNVTVVENKLHVKLSGPFRWRKAGKKQRSMFKVFPHMSYHISVYNNSKYNNSSKSMHHIQQSEDFLKYGPLEYNSQYCVRAEVLSHSLHLTSVWSNWSCVSIADDPFKSQLLLLTLGGFLPTAVCLFLLVAIGAFAYYYICGHKPQLPRSVKNIHHDENMEMRLQTFQTEKHLPSINLIIINNTNLSTGESKHAFLGSLHHTLHVPERLARPAGEGGYAAQDVQPGPKGHRTILNDDYGLIHLDAGAQARACAGGGVNSYMAQTGTTEPVQEGYEEEEEEEEEQGEDEMRATIFTWNQEPVPLQLDFPLLSRFSLKTTETPPAETHVLLPHRPDLTSVVVKQASEETGDDDPLLKMEQFWHLQVQSIAE